MPRQLLHIINGTREAGAEACIAIAYALGYPREEVFRARGLLSQKSLLSQKLTHEPNN